MHECVCVCTRACVCMRLCMCLHSHAMGNGESMTYLAGCPQITQFALDQKLSCDVSGRLDLCCFLALFVKFLHPLLHCKHLSTTQATVCNTVSNTHNSQKYSQPHSQQHKQLSAIQPATQSATQTTVSNTVSDTVSNTPNSH